ncbi:2-amino-4-hydroxy-6-hydroxymethyldihydropteridine diphosphokinase [Nocardiopsis sp. N85]|uniref:2-amino-4-hydroxy-6- hydroxymethyldihydropteridine diphosphokinase n=1 Tax=Nocardiopsis sp. N85 TaxID=3029400 RepID=UPI00237F16C3|nr:2-amino-4-hydroxy-6-hydroxymethyldihydropteridine diphosphokinase [Nocardiopsis sp. N85]MDE3720120.1 2-amino-4-hydroxy-6-hydroxymethyldihydropteridine diphosphokinase [Nocardiopsis sp. N85]
MTREMVIIGIGSNIDPEHHITSALNYLRSHGLDLEVSPWYRSPAIGLPAGAEDFLNLAVRLRRPWPRSLGDLKQLLGEMEVMHCRTRTLDGRWTSRTLDLDLLLAGDTIAPTLRLPHPDLVRYAHVAVPVADLIGEHTHPELGCAFTELAARLDTTALRKVEAPT